MRTLPMSRGIKLLHQPGGLPAASAAALLAGGLLLAAAVATLSHSLPLSPAFAASAVGLYGVIVLLLLRALRHDYPLPSFGLANAVTLLRALLACLFAGLAVEAAGQPLGTAAAWCFAAVGALALALDGLDGYLARRLGLCSAFGARFDMEVDALLILLLSLLAWLLDKAGAWVLLAGALRYLFLLAGALWPRLAGPLPPAWRRKAICVVQGVALCALLAPPLQPPASAWLAAVALALLLWSFAADAVHLLSTRRLPAKGAA